MWRPCYAGIKVNPYGNLKKQQFWVVFLIRVIGLLWNTCTPRVEETGWNLRVSMMPSLSNENRRGTGSGDKVGIVIYGGYSMIWLGKQWYNIIDILKNVSFVVV